ncbi:MAG: hypothetical protein JRC99_10805, partial [Deltaproteobacteria bacterium]|nr:hypothetical protein [Deltaproteobacteria bacterium]
MKPAVSRQTYASAILTCNQKKQQQSEKTGISLLLLVTVLSLFLVSPGQLFADDQETVTVITGTPGPDIIIPSLSDGLVVAAEIETEFSEKVEASATGIDSLAGNDLIIINIPTNLAVAATALLLNTPEKKTEAIAKSTGITSGEGNDTVDNSSVINIFGTSIGAYGDALEFEQPASVAGPGAPDKKEVAASAAATTEVTGVATGDGDDIIDNTGLLSIQSFTGLLAGSGEDIVTNDGIFTTSATATSGALAVGLVAPGETTPASDKKANIKTESNATSKATVVGIHGDDDETSSSSDDSSPFGVNGLRFTYEKTTTTTSGDDTIINNGFLTGNATATSGAGAASISNKVIGSVQTSAKSAAEATGTGINAGGGDDNIINAGELFSTATATSAALAVAVEIGAADNTAPPPPTPSKDKQSKSSTDVSSTAKATATGITADGDGNEETSRWSVALDDGLLQIDYQKTIYSLIGNDTVTNRFALQAFSSATSLTGAIGVTVSSGGSAESKANAEAESYGAGIVTGSGDDKISNRGLLTTESTANATAVSLGLAVGQPSEPIADGEPPAPTTLDKTTSKSETNVTAKARGYGIDAEGLADNVTTAGSLNIGFSGLDFSLSRTRELGSGNDTVSNIFGITVNTSASASSTAASIQIDAVGSVDAEAKATAETQAVGIATGAGDDSVVNSGLLLVDAIANADSVSFGLSASKPPD